MRLPPLSPTPELDLPTVRRAIAGDPQAFAQLYLRHRPIVLVAAQAVLLRFGRIGSAPELAAEVWLRLLDRGSLRTFDPSRSSFACFFKMVAWQQAFAVAQGWARRLARERVSPNGQLPEVECPPEADVADLRRWLSQITRAASPRLDAGDRELLDELYVHQRSSSEVASRLGCSSACLYKRHQRLRERLARAAQRIDPESSHRAASNSKSAGFLRAVPLKESTFRLAVREAS